MRYKANFHFHSAEDPLDILEYSLFEGVDEAVRLGFHVLASTCHGQQVCTDEHVSYAQRKGLLLIPGIEANIYESGSNRRNHVVILNCSKDVEGVRTFEDLRAYRDSHPDIFVLAAHPYYFGTFSLGDRFERYLDLFDAVEHSWFYTRWFNQNKRAQRSATEHERPFIATSDTHFFTYLDTNYALIESTECTAASLFASLRAHRFENVTAPRSLADILTVCVPFHTKHTSKRIIRSIGARIPILPLPAYANPKLAPLPVRYNTKQSGTDAS